MKIDLEVTGVKETVTALARFKDEYKSELESELNAAGQPLKQALQEYPPSIATSDYVRTYAYQQSVDVVARLEGEVVTLEVSADPVQHWLRGDWDGSYLGAWMHRGRWKTLKSLLDYWIPVITRRLSNRLYALISRLGLNG